ncbi:MAG: hypothetical protein GX096_01075 [Clostridiales bacterium]|nr:hypothetical protein [Clostridiales bacterium]
MLWKLVKYDCRAMMKQFGLIWPAAILVSLFTRFVLPFESDGQGGKLITSPNTAGIIGLVSLSIILVAMFVLVIVFLVNRYNKSLLSDEGYLMHTLPVASWQLIISKLLCGLIAILISIIVAIATILFVTSIAESLWTEGIMRVAFEALAAQPHIILQIIVFIILMIATTVQDILLIYTSITVGHLVSRFKSIAIGGTLIAGMSVITRLRLLLPWSSLGTTNDLGSSLTIPSQGDDMNISLICMALLFTLVVSAICFFITNYILKRKLNLE